MEKDREIALTTLRELAQRAEHPEFRLQAAEILLQVANDNQQDIPAGEMKNQTE